MLKKTLLMAALLLPACFAHAHEYTSGELHIAHPWSQELPPNAPTVAAYFVIHNNGKNADRLLSVTSPISAKAELHEHVKQGDPGEAFDVDIHLAPDTPVHMRVRLAHDDHGQLGFVCEHIDLASISHLRRLVELNLGDPQELERELGALIDIP